MPLFNYHPPHTNEHVQEIEMIQLRLIENASVHLYDSPSKIMNRIEKKT